MNQKFFALGKTNIYGFYTESNRGIGTGAFDTRLRVYGGGIEQSIDAAAMEMYVWYKRLEAHDPLPGEFDSDADVVTVGARIRF